jgi:hypothetical protein
LLASPPACARSCAAELSASLDQTGVEPDRLEARIAKQRSPLLLRAFSAREQCEDQEVKPLGSVRLVAGLDHAI